MSEIKQRKKESHPIQATPAIGSGSPKGKRKTSTSVGSDVNIVHDTTLNPQEQSSNSLTHSICLSIVTILALITRCWALHNPGEVVFDEVHFGKFASFYLRREYFFDVHPPLGKLLLAAVGYLVGYDGHFLFENIGDDYASNNVPYIAFRLFCAMCGALVVPFAYLTLKEMGCTWIGCTFAALMLVFDNALVTQSRLILLDSMLMLFGTMTAYTWVRFRQLRYRSFSFDWWQWLALTGVCLSLVMSVKLVGLFMVFTIGVATLFDLWDLLDIKRGLTLRQFSRHFSARALCLIFLPLGLYLFYFWIHFKVLIYSGSGDAFMSLKFQETLRGNQNTRGSTAVPLGSFVRLKHRDTDVYLHSHIHRYPLRYTDGRVSSQGQQVVGYAHHDENSYWELVPVDPKLIEGEYEPFELTDEEEERGVRYLKNLDLFQLRHNSTDSYLVTHDVASPLQATHMEMTTLPLEEAKKRYRETLWRVELEDGDEEGGEKVMSKKRYLRITNLEHKVGINTHKGPLPDWGYKMQEINGNKNIKERIVYWFIDDVVHERIVNGTEIGEEPPKDVIVEIPFLDKYAELQQLMFHHNAKLTASHPYQSAPISWPFVISGISFWERKEGFRQIYLLGNPFVWWFCIFGPLLYMALWAVDRIILHRGVDEFGVNIRRWWDRALGFLILCWVMHWIPFFLMVRALFLHHYLPSFIFAAMTTGCLIDVLGRGLFEPSATSSRVGLPYMVWLTKHKPTAVYILLVTLLSIGFISSFLYFAPMCYGSSLATEKDVQARKWIESWNFQHA